MAGASSGTESNAKFCSKLRMSGFLRRTTCGHLVKFRHDSLERREIGTGRFIDRGSQVARQWMCARTGEPEKRFDMLNATNYLIG
ncbi:MAG: hypothetical protein J4F97_06200, partial [Pseudomonadales bacterium]|nr:hypothetical protein [Pseudomonadales bacterium]